MEVIFDGNDDGHLTLRVIFTDRKRSSGKVMFFRASVCSQGGRTLPPPGPSPRLGTTKADSTHPTGMLSCLGSCFHNKKGQFFKEEEMYNSLQ